MATNHSTEWAGAVPLLSLEVLLWVKTAAVILFPTSHTQAHTQTIHLETVSIYTITLVRAPLVSQHISYEMQQIFSKNLWLVIIGYEQECFIHHVAMVIP